MKITLELTNYDAHPVEIFKAIENRRSDIEWSKRDTTIPFPKYQKSPKLKLTTVMAHFVRNTIMELRP